MSVVSEKADGATAAVGAGDEASSAAQGSGILSLSFLVVGGGNYVFSVALAYVLSQGSYGVVALVQGFLLFAAWFTSAGFPWTVARRLSRTSAPLERAAAVRGALLGNLVVALALSAVLLALVFSGALQVGSESAMPLLLAALACSIAGVNAAGKGSLQGLFRFRAVAIVNIVEIVIKLGVGLGLAAAGLGPTGAALGILAGLIVATVLSLVLMRDLHVLRGRGVGGRDLVRETLPLFLGTAGMAMLTSLDLFGVKILTPGERSNEIAAIYQAAVTLGRIPYFFASALTTAVFPHVSRTRHDLAASGLYVRKGVLYVVALLAPISLVFIAIPHAALAALYPDQYDDAAPALRLTATGTTFLALAAFLVGALQATGRDRLPAVTVLGAVCLEAIALGIGIPLGARRGVDGAQIAAATAFVVATAFAALVLFAACARIYRWRVRWRGPVGFCVAASGMVTVLVALPHASRLAFAVDVAAGFGVYAVLAVGLGVLSPGDLRTLRSGIPGMARKPLPTTLTTAGLQIVCHRGPQAFDDVGPAWTLLLGDRTDVLPFLRPAWLRAWWEVYGRGRECRIVEIRASGRPVALAFLQVTVSAALGTRRLGFIGGAPGDRRIWLANPHGLGAAYFNDLLVAPGHEDDAVRGLRAWLEASTHDWDEIRLAAIAEESSLATGWQALLDGWAPTVERQERWLVDCSAGWDAYYASCSVRRRRHIRYEQNALERLVGGPLADEWVRGPDVGAAMEEFLEMHAQRWTAAHRPGLQSGERELYRALAAASSDEIVVVRLRGGDKVVAMQWGFDDGRRYLPYNFAFDARLTKESPSNVLVQKVVRRCCEDGHREVDLAGLGTAEHWTDTRRARLLLRARSARSGSRRRVASLALAERCIAGAHHTPAGRKLRELAAAVVSRTRRIVSSG